MATHTIQRLRVHESRIHDHLYDPEYVVSGERDHTRANIRALAANTKEKRMPIYDTMFSELRRLPRLEVRVDATDLVPPSIPRDWTAHQPKPARNEDPQVSGVNRYKYFMRGGISIAESSGPPVVLATARQESMMWSSSAGLGSGLGRSGALTNRRSAPTGLLQTTERRPASPRFRTIQTQTDYRESEAQTDPYTPDYTIRPGTQPEILTLALLSYGCGLPAGLAEVEMIERAREKRAWEASLPPLNDVSQHEKRQSLMETQQRKEWVQREQEIEKLQEARLKVLTQLLKQRERQHQELNTKRLDQIWSQKQEDKTEIVGKIRSEHIRMLRKLTAKRSNVEGRLQRPGIIANYSNFGSQAYAPLMRIGVYYDRNADQFAVRNKYTDTYKGLLELESSLPPIVTQPIVKAPVRRTTTSAGFTKRKYRQEDELANIHNAILVEKQKGPQSARPLRFLEKVEIPPPRPATPSVQGPTDEEEEMELAVIFLQSMMRGRAAQNEMHEGKERRQELIDEIRSTHGLQEAGQQAVAAQELLTSQLQQQHEQFLQKELAVDAALAELEGECIGETLDFLSKELVRLQEERRIHAFALLADRDRRIREAAESGMRQAEERRRREEDEIFKQVVKVHQTSVDEYLEDIILSTIGREADSQARMEIQEMAQKINEIAQEAEKRRTSLESEEIVSELVHCFLIPEVQKQTMRENLREHQKKFLLAANAEISGICEQLSRDVSLSRKMAEDGGSRPGAADQKPKSRASSRAKSMASDVDSRPGSAAMNEKAKQSSKPGSRAEDDSSRRVTGLKSEAVSRAEVEKSPVPEEGVEGEETKLRTSSRAKSTEINSRPGSSGKKSISRASLNNDLMADGKTSRPGSDADEPENKSRSSSSGLDIKIKSRATLKAASAQDGQGSRAEILEGKEDAKSRTSSRVRSGREEHQSSSRPSSSAENKEKSRPVSKAENNEEKEETVKSRTSSRVESTADGEQSSRPGSAKEKAKLRSGSKAESITQEGEVRRGSGLSGRSRTGSRAESAMANGTISSVPGTAEQEEQPVSASRAQSAAGEGTQSPAGERTGSRPVSGEKDVKSRASSKASEFELVREEQGSRPSSEKKVRSQASSKAESITEKPSSRPSSRELNLRSQATSKAESAAADGFESRPETGRDSMEKSRQETGRNSKEKSRSGSNEESAAGGGSRSGRAGEEAGSRPESGAASQSRSTGKDLMEERNTEEMEDARPDSAGSAQ